MTVIKYYFECISFAITRLETNGVPVGDALRTFKSIRTNLESIPTRKGFLQKFKYVLNQNEGLKTLERIAHILEEGELDEADEFIDGLNPVN